MEQSFPFLIQFFDCCLKLLLGGCIAAAAAAAAVAHVLCAFKTQKVFLGWVMLLQAQPRAVRVCWKYFDELRIRNLHTQYLFLYIYTEGMFLFRQQSVYMVRQSALFVMF